jgi:hypothetical protein
MTDKETIRMAREAGIPEPWVKSEQVKRFAALAAKRKPLTDEEIDKVTDAQWSRNNHKPIYAAHRAYARAIEQAHEIGSKE